MTDRARVSAAAPKTEGNMEKMAVTVRAASADDAQTVVKIINAGWQAAYVGMVPQAYLDSLSDNFRGHIRDDIASGRLSVLLLLEDGVPAGIVGFGKSRDGSLADWGEIDCLYVHPRFWRRGYGKTLLCAAVDALAQHGFRDCFLWVLEENRNAREFYSAMGFRAADDVTHSEIIGKCLTEVRYCFSMK